MIGPAKNIGRDRWWQFAKFLERLAETSGGPSFEGIMQTSSTSDERFEIAFAAASKASGQTTKKAKKARPLSRRTWSAKDKAASATLQSADKKAIVTLKSKDGPRFAEFLTDELDRLYEEFRQSQARSTGD